MPPRFAYWTIILEGKPTAFRANHREDLLPTLKQLQARHPDVVMRWFARGKLWDSPEAAADAVRRGGQHERRPKEWRPGGEHRDPRARFDIPRDEKRRRFAAQLRRDARDRDDADRPRHERPEGDRRPPSRPFRPAQDRVDRAKPREPSPGAAARPKTERPRFDRPRRDDRRSGGGDRWNPDNRSFGDRPGGRARPGADKRKDGKRPGGSDRRGPENRKFGNAPGGFRPGPNRPGGGRKPGGPGRGGRGGRGGSGTSGGGGT